jgi:catechol 2,3-dioxygenase-like lactoylglutathione lyase family enzyme
LLAHLTQAYDEPQKRNRKRHKTEDTKGARKTGTMTTHNIECEQHHTGIVVSDLAAAIDFYTNKLGFWLSFKWGEPTTMAGVNLGHVQIFLEHGEPSPKGCYLYFVVNDADAFHGFHRNNGVEIVQPIGDREYGIRDYSVRDLYGYILSFGHRLPGNCDEGDEGEKGDHS